MANGDAHGKDTPSHHVAATAWENSKRLERLEARVASLEEQTHMLGASIADLEDAIDES